MICKKWQQGASWGGRAPNLQKSERKSTMRYLSVQVVREPLSRCCTTLKHGLLNGAGLRNKAVASITVSRISLGFLAAD